MTKLTSCIRFSEHVYLAYAEFPHVDSGNVYLVTGEHPTLIDCGSARILPQLIDNLSQLNIDVQDIEQVIATHGDFDHVQGFHGLHRLNPHLRLLIHELDRSIVQADNAYHTASYLYGQPFVRLQASQCIPVADGDILPAGDGSLTVHHTPGHSEGSICLLGEIDHRTLLFAGDAIGGSMKSLDGATLEIWAQAAMTWETSLSRLSALEFDWILSGHEPAFGLPLTRARFERMVAHFGKMLNPWYLPGDSDLASNIST
jgi:glyoxylase-like metal-dependent hydrolase (beta-lactamase superfamily II)